MSFVDFIYIKTKLVNVTWLLQLLCRSIVYAHQTSPWQTQYSCLEKDAKVLSLITCKFIICHATDILSGHMGAYVHNAHNPGGRDIPIILLGKLLVVPLA